MMEIKRVKHTKRQNKNMLDLLSIKLKCIHEEVKADKELFLTLMCFELKVVMSEPIKISFSNIDPRLPTSGEETISGRKFCKFWV